MASKHKIISFTVDTDMKTNGKTIVLLLRALDLFFIVYFAMALNLPEIILSGQIQLRMIVKVLRPFVSVLIPLYNIGYTIFALVSLFFSLILAASKLPDMDSKESIVNIAKVKPIKRRIARKVSSLIRELAMVWLAWSYGARYMAFIVFATLILDRLLIRVANSAVETAKDKVVQMVSKGDV
ncbi:hypothetical protein FACS1894161_4450 [Spirochaetia bacterium]|nr:hypothetical protein FACS1894161_4450 [Spirochaetia bacterium]